MLKFKELLKNDARQIMSVVELAEFLQLNGVIIAAQFIPSTEKLSASKDDDKAGLYGDVVTLYFKTADYTAKSGKQIPKQGDYVYLQVGNFKRRYEVIISADSLGVTRLELGILRQRH